MSKRGEEKRNEKGREERAEKERDMIRFPALIPCNDYSKMMFITGIGAVNIYRETSLLGLGVNTHSLFHT